MRTPLLLAALLLVPGCSGELPLIEIGDLQGLPIGGILESSNAALSETVATAEESGATSTVAADPIPETPAIANSAVQTIVSKETNADQGSGEQETDEDEEILLVGFDTLADFDYEVPTTEQVEKGTHKQGQIPEDVLALDGKRIEVEGYMVPMEVEKGMVKSFVLSRSLAGCCFGDWPILNEWVDVVMKEGEGADYVPYAPVLVVGRLTVSEAVDEYGVLSIYRMVAETVEDPW